ncbi:MAG: class I SAM-dependent methyltransferase [Alphaproteobacteria bacterium]|nr:MAG: class I SAM-dependent methyltransferase [Alphaproteobacteria bacterium]
MDKKSHWEDIYQRKGADKVSWHQEQPGLSLRMIADAGLERGAAIIDVGGGASRLIDSLIAQGYTNLTVLDISGRALEAAKERLGPLSQRVQWVESDIADFKPRQKFKFWHDRAVFHFLTDPQDRDRYLETMRRSLDAGSYAMIAAFAPDGPEKCSGLPVQRYSHESLQLALGPSYKELAHHSETHVTPAGGQQKFVYALFRKM